MNSYEVIVFLRLVLLMCMYVFEGTCMYVQALSRPEKGVKSPETGITDSCVQLGGYCEQAHSAMFPAPVYGVFCAFKYLST